MKRSPRPAAGDMAHIAGGDAEPRRPRPADNWPPRLGIEDLAGLPPAVGALIEAAQLGEIPPGMKATIPDPEPKRDRAGALITPGRRPPHVLPDPDAVVLHHAGCLAVNNKAEAALEQRCINEHMKPRHVAADRAAIEEGRARSLAWLLLLAAWWQHTQTQYEMATDYQARIAAAQESAPKKW